MLKIKSILVSMLAVAALASCSDDNEPTRQSSDFDGAYMSLRIALPTQANTRVAGTSAEKDPADAAETAINSLYVVTFDTNKNLVHHARMNAVTVLSPTELTTPTGNGYLGTKTAILVSASTKYLLVVANPGKELAAQLTSSVTGTSFDDINKAIQVNLTTGDKPEKLVGEIMDATNGFTMINSGTYNTTGNNQWDEGCLLDVTNNIAVVDGAVNKTEAEAVAEAEGNRATLKIERLAAKVEVGVKAKVDLEILPDGADFEFEGWTLDYYNSTFYPYAEKATTKASHTSSFYGNNFYTKDPNFEGGNLMTGIEKNELVNREPQVTWKDATVSGSPGIEYCIENTMAADDQRFGAATRVVIKGLYAPKNVTLGDDWFSFAGINYKDLDQLKAAYAAAATATPQSPA